MEVNKVYKKSMVTKWEVVYYQLLTYCFFNKIELSEADLNCVVLFSLDPNNISDFCNLACEKGIFKTPQSVRNSLNKIVKKGLIIKDKNNRKHILKINPSIGLVSEGNVLLNYNFLGIEANKI